MCDGSGKGIRVATNGTLDPKMDMSFYEEAYKYCKYRNILVLYVDGIDEKSQIYRIGSNFEQVWEAMKLGREDGSCYCITIYHLWL